MKPVVWLPLSLALLSILPSCSNQNSTAGNDPLGTGPFDADGNYVDAWANDPSKWSRPGKRQRNAPVEDELPLVAQVDQPPAHANPLGQQTVSTPKPATRVESTPRQSTRPSTTPKPVAKSTTTRPKPAVAKAKPKPKPKAAPKPTRYVVKSGDSLSRIASRTGSSVTAIQRANGIKGTLIHPGQSLVIPKR